MVACSQYRSIVYLRHASNDSGNSVGLHLRVLLGVFTSWQSTPMTVCTDRTSELESYVSTLRDPAMDYVGSA